jgi:hypothetical protein
MPASAMPPASGGGMLSAHNQHAQVPSWVFSCGSAGLSNTSSSGAAPFEFGKGLLVYVQLSKTGSSSMRHMMFQAYGKPFSLYGYMHEGSTFMGEVHGIGSCSSTCSGECDKIGTCHPTPPLPRLDAAELVQGSFGTCDVLSKRWESSRPCAYFSVLREPIARLLSSYDYFCRNCREAGRYCENPLVVGRGGARCPAMSLLDFARLEGNLYTREFSGAAACAPCAHPRQDAIALRQGKDRVRQYPEACAEAAADHSGEDAPGVRAQRLQRAKENLRQSVFPIFTDEMEAGLRVLHAHLGRTPLLRMPDAAAAAAKNTNALHHEQHSPSALEPQLRSELHRSTQPVRSCPPPLRAASMAHPGSPRLAFGCRHARGSSTTCLPPWALP